MQELNESTFEQAVSEGVVLVDFWAPWCQPCRALAPHLDRIDQEYGAAVLVAKVNVDENPTLRAQYVDRGIPTLRLFKDGQVVESLIGMHPAAKIREMVDRYASDPATPAEEPFDPPVSGQPLIIKRGPPR